MINEKIKIKNFTPLHTDCVYNKSSYSFLFISQTFYSRAIFLTTFTDKLDHENNIIVSSLTS